MDLDRKPHKVMTPEEYAAMPIIGWHEVCRDVDGFGGVGIRFLGEQQERMPGIDPKTGKYSTAQMMLDEMTMGDTSQPLFD